MTTKYKLHFAFQVYTHFHSDFTNDKGENPQKNLKILAIQRGHRVVINANRQFQKLKAPSFFFINSA